MKTRHWLVAGLPALAFASAAFAQPYPLVDALANKVVQKYQNQTCEQIAANKAAGQQRPKSPAEQRILQLLREDPGARAEFFGKVSAPIVNKLFECGMIP